MGGRAKRGGVREEELDPLQLSLRDAGEDEDEEVGLLPADVVDDSGVPSGHFAFSGQRAIEDGAGESSAAAEDGKGIGASVGIDVESEEEGGDEEDAESDEEESDSDDDEEDDDEDDDLLLDLEDWPLLDRGNAYMM